MATVREIMSGTAKDIRSGLNAAPQWHPGFCNSCATEQRETKTIKATTITLTICRGCLNESDQIKIKRLTGPKSGK